MLRTISIKLLVTQDQATRLADLQKEFSSACNALVPYVIENRCWNRVALHSITYDKLRMESALGSQMTCNAIFAVCMAYKAQQVLGKITKDTEVPSIKFRKASVHFDKRTYTLLPSGQLSLYTLLGRIKVDFTMGNYQRKLFDQGLPKEAELLCKDGTWYFNLVLELPDTPKVKKGVVMGVDIGENNLAATSTGKIFGGEELRHKRDRFQDHRRRLQSNGTQSGKQKLCKVSGREARHVKHVNHEISATIIAEALRIGASLIVLEDLTNIRDRIRAKLRVRSRLHRWPFRQLQQFVCYKAENVGIEVKYVNPAYTSRCCSTCLQIGTRKKHQFRCSNCGLLAHADCNASRNLARIAVSADIARANVSWPNVGTMCVP
jgi:putative transposase